MTRPDPKPDLVEDHDPEDDDRDVGVPADAVAAALDSDVTQGLALLAGDSNPFEKFSDAGGKTAWVKALHNLKTPESIAFLAGYRRNLKKVVDDRKNDMKTSLMGYILVRGILLAVGLSFLAWLLCDKVMGIDMRITGMIIATTIFGGILAIGFGLYAFVRSALELSIARARLSRLHGISGASNERAGHPPSTPKNGKRQRSSSESPLPEPSNFVGWFNRGNSQMDSAQWEDALASFDRALHARSRDSDAWNNRAVVLARLGRHPEALASFLRALDLNPKDPDLWLGRGEVEELLGRVADAARSYHQYLALSPSDDAAQTTAVRERLQKLKQD